MGDNMNLRDQAIQAMRAGADAADFAAWETYAAKSTPAAGPFNSGAAQLEGALDGLLGFLRDKEGLHNRRVAVLLDLLGGEQ